MQLADLANEANAFLICRLDSKIKKEVKADVRKKLNLSFFQSTPQDAAFLHAVVKGHLHLNEVSAAPHQPSGWFWHPWGPTADSFLHAGSWAATAREHCILACSATFLCNESAEQLREFHTRHAQHQVALSGCASPARCTYLRLRTT